MIQLFYSNRTLALVVLPMLVGGYVVLNLFFPVHLPEDTAHFGFYNLQLNQKTTVAIVLAPMLICVEAIVINLIYNRNEFFDRNNFLPSLIFVVFLSYFHSFYFLDGFGIAFFFLTLMIYQLFRLNQNEDGRKTTFNIGFLLGVAGSVFPLMLGILPLVFIMVWVFRPFVFREGILLLLGLSTPLLYATAYRWIAKQPLDLQILSTSSNEKDLINLAVVGGAALFFGILSVKTAGLKMQQGSIRIRKIYNALILMLFTTTALAAADYFFFEKLSSASLILLPLTFVFPYAFGYKHLRKESVILFYVLLIVSVGKFFREYFL